MSLFQCQHCGCCENTALTNHGWPYKGWEKHFDWTGIENRKGMQLCSACSPTNYSDGKSCSKSGRWHEQFERVYLPQGEFFTNKTGNLEHRETGSEDFRQFRIEP